MLTAKFCVKEDISVTRICHSCTGLNDLAQFLPFCGNDDDIHLSKKAE